MQLPAQRVRRHAPRELPEPLPRSVELVASQARLTSLRKLRIIQAMELIAAPLFTKLLPKYLSGEQYRQLQLHLVSNPESGDLIPRTGGFRKAAGRTAGGGREHAAASGSSTTTWFGTCRSGS